MKIEIVTIGDELLLGFTIDTNAAHLASRARVASASRSRIAPQSATMQSTSPERCVRRSIAPAP